MSETDNELKPYRYMRRFDGATKSTPVAEMDKDALQAYIKKILAPGDGKAGASEITSK